MRKNGNNELNRGAKTKFVSVLPIIGASLLGAGALAGVGLSAWHITRSYKESSEFANSVSARVKIDPVAFLPEDSSLKADEKTATENTKMAAERLSAWLKQNGQESYDVSYELEAPTIAGHQYYAYLTAKFKIDKVTSKLTSDKDKVEDDPVKAIFENRGFNTNNKSFIYRWYDKDNKADPTRAEPRYTILNFSDLFVIPEKLNTDGAQTKVMQDKDAKNGIVYKVNSKNIHFLETIYKDYLEYKEDTKDKETQDASNKDADVKLQPRIYIINNLEGLYNEASYHLTNWGYCNKDSTDHYQEYQRIYKDSDYEKFASTYFTTSWKGDTGSKHYKLGDVKLRNPDGTESSKVEENGDILNWIDAKTAGTMEHSVIMSKYVEDIIPVNKFSDYFKENIDNDKIKNTIPTDITKKDDTKITYFWHGYSNQATADKYFSNMIEKGWAKSKIVGVELTSDESFITNFNQFGEICKATVIAPKFTETIFGSNKLVGILSLGFLAFLVTLGILLGCLYRTTGIFSWISMMFMLSMTGLIASFGGGGVISLSLLFGLFTLAIAGFITAIGICGRMKRRLLSNEDTQVIVNKTFKQSMWHAADISIIALIFGICFTYIAPLGVNALGLILIIGSFANFIGTYLFNGLLHILWFNNKVTINHYGWFGKTHNNVANEVLTQRRNDLPVTLDASRLNFQHYSKLCTKRLDVTSKGGIIALSIVGALLIAGILSFTLIGFINTKLFHAENCLLVFAENKDVNMVDIVRSAGLDFSSYVISKDGLVGYFYCSSIANEVLEKVQEAAGVSDASAQFIIGATNRDLLNYTIISIIVAGGVSTLYAGIRNNWTAFVPMLLGAMGLPMITLGVAAIAQLKFDETIVLAFALITVINTIICINLINTTNCVWSRYEGYNKPEFKFIINESLKNNFLWYIITAAAYALFIATFAVTAPIGSLYISLLMIVGMVVTMLLAPIAITTLLYRFLIIRNHGLRRRAVRLANKKYVNYDEIDEQSIEEMNKFPKHIPVPKDEPLNNEQK